MWRVAATSGVFAVALQFALQARFRRSPDPALNKAPGYVAHQAVALIYMLAATVIGSIAFFSPARWPATASAAMLGTDGTTRLLAALLLGELVYAGLQLFYRRTTAGSKQTPTHLFHAPSGRCWDLPCVAAVPKLRSQLDMVAHHVVMAATAYVVMAHAPIFFGTFYLGAAELSTLPLNAHEYYAFAHEATQAEAPEDESRLAALATRRDLWQAAAALSFVVVRGGGFTWLTARRMMPQGLHVLRSGAAAAAGAPLWPVRALLGFVVSFNVLQLYWLGLLIAYTFKNGMGGSRDCGPEVS